MLLIGEDGIRSAGLSLIIISALLYFFQGLAVFVHYVDKWKVPVYLKIAIYGILILQSYGLLLLSILGLADVWLDFRKKTRTNNQTTE